MIQKEMTRGLVFLTVFAVLLLSTTFPLATATAEPTVGEMLPPITLKVPQDAAARIYLGLKNADRFTVPEIKAQVVIIEVFNMY